MKKVMWFSLRSVLAGAALFIAGNAMAQQNLFWNGSITGYGSGASDVWNTADANWSSTVDGATLGTWSNSSGDYAVIGGSKFSGLNAPDGSQLTTSRNISLGSDITADRIYFGLTAYPFDGYILDLAGHTLTLNTANAIQGVNKDSNALVPYHQTFAIGGSGTLLFGANQVLDGIKGASFNIGSNIDLNGNNLTVNESQQIAGITHTISGNISGSGTVTFENNRNSSGNTMTMLLSGTGSDYTGDTVVSSTFANVQVMQLGADNALSSSSAITLSRSGSTGSDAILDVGSHTSGFGGLSSAGSGGTVQFDANGTTAGSLTLASGGLLNLSGLDLMVNGTGGESSYMLFDYSGGSLLGTLNSFSGDLATQGYSVTDNGTQLLLTIPEPSTFVLMGIALAALLYSRRKLR